MTNNVYPITLRAKDGREQRTLAWFPVEAARRDLFEKAQRNGLEVIVNEE